MNRRVTHKDIADRLGLDKSTVSLALRNHPRITAETTRRVKEMAKELKYHPDPLRSLLAHDRWAGHRARSGIGIAYFIHTGISATDMQRRFWEPVRRRAAERGYPVTVFDLANYARVDALHRVLSTRGIRGILLPQFAADPGIERMLIEQEEFTVVCLDNGRWRPPFHRISGNIFTAARLVWGEVRNRGYQRIGGALLTHCPPAVDDLTRLGGSMVTQADMEPPEVKLPLLRSHLDDFDSFERWLKETRPDAVVGVLPLVYDWILRAGLRVPEDVAFACMIVDLKEERHRILSGYPGQDDAIAQAGVDSLIAAILANEGGVPSLSHELLLEPEWHEGATLPDQTNRNQSPR